MALSMKRGRATPIALIAFSFAVGFAVLSACVTSRPGDPLRLHSTTGAYLSGHYAAAQKDLQAAAELFDLAAGAQSDDLKLNERAFFQALAAGEMESALRLARDVRVMDDTHPVAHLVEAASSLKASRYEEAEAALGEIALGPVNAGLGAVLVAWARAAVQDADGALSALQSAEQTAFGSFMALHRALILDYCGRTEQARRAYAQALRSPATLMARDAYGRFLEREGDPGEARQFYQELADLTPGDALARAGLSRLNAGIQPAPFVTKPREGAAVAFVAIGAALSRDRSLEPPLIYANMGLYLSPEFDQALLLKGQLLESAKLWDEADASYSRIEASSSLYEFARIGVANARTEQDDTKAAIAALRSIVREGPDSAPNATVYLGDILRSEERYDEAIEAYDAALEAKANEAQSEAWRILFARGVAFERSKKWDKAEKDFLKALEMSPEQPFVLNYLGYSWVDRNENLDEAFAMIERAVTLRPNEGAFVDSLGWAHYRLGRFAEAVRHLERAAALEPGDPTVVDHLGDAYWRVGRALEARYQWERALELEPEDDVAETIRMKLLQGLEPPASAE